jgi:hypothetical protein
MTTPFPSHLNPEPLMAHMHALCKQIGPRPSASAKEAAAADYVKGVLARLGVQNVAEQHFRSQNTLGWVLLPAALLQFLGLLLMLLAGRLGALAGGLLVLVSAYTIYGFARLRPAPFDALIRRSESRNVVATLAPSGPAQRRMYLVGHLDSNKQRRFLPPPNQAWLKPLADILVVAPVIFGLLGLLWALLPPAWGLENFLRPLIVGYLVPGLAALALMIWDETQPTVEGANDNASAVSVLLGIAAALQTAPLAHTEVTLLFTGCEEVGCTGMLHYLRQARPPRENTYWIDLEMVGAGKLAYITQHGISHLTQYRPEAHMADMAAKVAQQRQELGVSGKDLLIIEEVSTLRDWGAAVIGIAGYREPGYLINWHRVSDRLENIEPAVLSRAAQYTWALVQEIEGA